MIDPIQLERFDGGRTRASVQLTSGLDVFGAWATGDAQAYRALIKALMEVADEATVRTDRAARQIADMTVNARLLRDQLRKALDDNEELCRWREEAHLEGSRRLGELMAEITTLKMDLAAARATPTVTADAARAVVERDNAIHAFRVERDNAVRALQAEKCRLDAAVERLHELERKALIPDDIQQNALDAALAADEAFEEAKWKEGSRYLKLANMWVGLLNAVATSPQPSPVETQ